METTAWWCCMLHILSLRLGWALFRVWCLQASLRPWATPTPVLQHGTAVGAAVADWLQLRKSVKSLSSSVTRHQDTLLCSYWFKRILTSSLTVGLPKMYPELMTINFGVRRLTISVNNIGWKTCMNHQLFQVEIKIQISVVRFKVKTSTQILCKWHWHIDVVIREGFKKIGKIHFQGGTKIYLSKSSFIIFKIFGGFSIQFKIHFLQTVLKKWSRAGGQNQKGNFPLFLTLP